MVWVESYRSNFGFRAFFGDLGTQFGHERLNVIVPLTQNAFWGSRTARHLRPTELHAAGSNLAVCLRAGPELLGTVA